MIINPTLKDTVLKYLIANAKVEYHQSGDTQTIIKEMEVDFDSFYAVMTYFERIGFLRELGLNRRGVHFILLTEAHDFYLRGGFTVQEEVLEVNLKKLLLEVDHLKRHLGPNHLDTVEKISTIASALFAGLGLLPKT